MDEEYLPTDRPWRVCDTVPVRPEERMAWEEEGWEDGEDGRGMLPSIFGVHLHQEATFLKSMSELTGGKVRDPDAVVESVVDDGDLILHVCGKEIGREGREGTKIKRVVDISSEAAAEKVEAIIKGCRLREDFGIETSEYISFLLSFQCSEQDCVPGIDEEGEYFAAGPRVRKVTGKESNQFDLYSYIAVYCNIYSTVSFIFPLDLPSSLALTNQSIFAKWGGGALFQSLLLFLPSPFFSQAAGEDLRRRSTSSTASGAAAASAAEDKTTQTEDSSGAATGTDHWQIQGQGPPWRPPPPPLLLLRPNPLPLPLPPTWGWNWQPPPALRWRLQQHKYQQHVQQQQQQQPHQQLASVTSSTASGAAAASAAEDKTTQTEDSPLVAGADAPPAGPLDPRGSREAARLAAEITEALEAFAEDLRRRRLRRAEDPEEEAELAVALKRSRID